MKTKQEVSISPSIVVFSAFFLTGLYFLYFIRSILVLLFLAFIIVVALSPSVDLLQKRAGVPRILSILIVYFLVFGSLIGLLALVIPPLTNELYTLVKTLNVPPSIQDEIRDFRFTMSELGTFAERIGTSLTVLISVITSTFTGIIAFFTLIVLSFYMMLDKPYLHRKVRWFSADEKYTVLAKEFLDSMQEQLGGWVRGQITLMLVIGLITYFGLTLLSIPYALPLAILAGLLEVLPNIGPTIAAIPAIILAFLFMGPVMAGVCVLFYFLVQQVENNFLVPKIMRDNADVSPLVSIVVILIGLQAAGVLGALLAVPSYIVMRTLYFFWFRFKTEKVTA